MSLRVKRIGSDLSLIAIITSILLMSLLTLFGQGASTAEAENETPIPNLFTAGETAKGTFALVADDEMEERLHAVSINMSALSATEIRLNPFAGLNVIAHHEKSTFGAEGSFVWQGSLADERFSEVYLSFNQGILVGKIKRGTGEVYELRYTPDDCPVLPEEDSRCEHVPASPVATQDLLPLSVASPASVVETRGATSTPPPDDGSVVTLMVLYTPAARDAAGGTAAIKAEIDLVMAKINQGAVNSQLNFAFQLVHSGEISASEAISYPGGIINNLQLFPEVGQLRDQYAADLVSIWQEQLEATESGSGFQFSENDMRRSEWGFHRVRRHSALTSYTVIHEIGHNMGAGHDFYTPATLQSQLEHRVHPYAFGYADETAGFFTIMGGPSGPNPPDAQINYFSNPLVFTRGVPVGTVYSPTSGYGNDNARVLNEVAFLVSNYRISPSTDQTFIVDTVVDDWRLIGCQDGVPHDCSLRGAIRLANADITTRPYTITLATAQTYLLTETSSLYYDDDYNTYGDFDVKTDITIEGNGSTVDGNNLRGVFQIHGSKGALTLRNTTVRGGNTTGSGGGVLNQSGRVTLINSHLISNTAQIGGGGLHNSGQVLLQNSSVISNVSSGIGGGVFHQAGVMRIENTTLAYNRATSLGGGIYAVSPLTLSHSTVSTNTTASHGGGIYAFSPLTVLSTTVAANQAVETGGGIVNYGPSTFINTNITNNRSQTRYGGGALLLGSATIEHSQFQGNQANLYGGGLVAVGPSLDIANTQVTSNTAGTEGGGMSGSAVVVAEEITVASNRSGTSGGGIHWTGNISLRESQIVSNTAMVDGGGAHLSAPNVWLTDTVIMSNTAGGNGGGVIGSAVSSMDEVTIAHNHSGATGGGVHWTGNTTLSQSQVFSNTAAVDGGGLHLSAATVRLTDTSILSNAVSRNGAGLNHAGSQLFITGTTFRNNKINAQGNNGAGGGIYTSAATTITLSTIMSNTTEFFGSGILAGSNLTVLSSTISHNQGGGWPGAIYAFGPTLIRGSTVAYNQRGIVVRDDPLRIENSTISHNQEHGIWLHQSGASAYLTHTTVVSNTGAGIFVENDRTVTMTAYASIIAHNLTNSCSGNRLVKQSQGDNLTSDSSCGLVATGDTVAGNTLLGPLALHGGLTASHMPLAGSPARDTVPAGNCTVARDQRGWARPYNTACDKGSIEYRPESSPIPPIISMGITGNGTPTFNWGTNSANCSYTIYRSSNPYADFAVLGTVSSAPYTDPNGAGTPAANYFYRVTAGSCPAGTQTADSKTMGVFNFALKPGN